MAVCTSVCLVPARVDALHQLLRQASHRCLALVIADCDGPSVAYATTSALALRHTRIPHVTHMTILALSLKAV